MDVELSDTVDRLSRFSGAFVSDQEYVSLPLSRASSCFQRQSELSGNGGPIMLVLSRGCNDKVVFPTLGITIEIVRIVGSRVRIGIDAPKDVPILREEILGDEHQRTFERKALSPSLNHAIRNRLQNATLGLRLVQKMLELDKADDIEPTIFKIFNDLKSLEEELAGPETPPVVKPQPAKRSKSCRALIVEDDINESELLAEYLRLTGFEVSTAVDGLQAMVQLSKKERPDVVLLDMKMPKFDGSKTVSAIRQNPDYQSLKIFAVTGTDQAEASVDIGPRGVDRWFQKPVDPERLVSAIHNDLTVELASA